MIAVFIGILVSILYSLHIGMMHQIRIHAVHK